MTDAQTPSRSEVLQGTLEMLTLKLLTVEPMHGWGLSIRLRQISGDVFDVNQGSLYPALQRMKRRIQRALVDVEDVAADLPESNGEPPTVHGLDGQKLESQHLERALE